MLHLMAQTTYRWRDRLVRNMPSSCLLCGTVGPGRLCTQCQSRFVDRCWVLRCLGCALPLLAASSRDDTSGTTSCARCAACVERPLPFGRAVAALDYEHPWTSAILASKSPHGFDRVELLASLMVDALRHAHAQADVVVPMPSSPGRLAERGFNPAWELARRVAGVLGVGSDPWALSRPLDAPSQQGRGREARARGVQGAFVVDPRRASGLRGKHVALVDDVMTTGATSTEAARALLAAGVARVDLWVLARTPPPGWTQEHNTC